MSSSPNAKAIYDLANYTTAVQHTVRNDKRNVEVFNAKANAAWRAPTGFPLQLKAGAFFRHHFVEEVNGTRRWDRAAVAPPLPAGTRDVTSQEVRLGVDLPFPEPAETALKAVLRNAGEAGEGRVTAE